MATIYKALSTRELVLVFLIFRAPLVCNHLGCFPVIIGNLLPPTPRDLGRDQRKRQAIPAWLVAVWINKGNLRSLSSGAARWWTTEFTRWTLEVCIETITSFSHIYHAGVLNTTSLAQGCVLKVMQPLEVGKASRPTAQGQQRGWRTPEYPVPAHGPVCSHIFSMIIPNRHFASHDQVKRGFQLDGDWRDVNSSNMYYTFKYKSPILP